MINWRVGAVAEPAADAVPGDLAVVRQRGAVAGDDAHDQRVHEQELRVDVRGAQRRRGARLLNTLVPVASRLAPAQRHAFS